ncbi:MAG: hypothetical protein ACMUEK_00370 [Sodalis sp. (in: enterobacteria)]
MDFIADGGLDGESQPIVACRRKDGHIIFCYANFCFLSHVFSCVLVLMLNKKIKQISLQSSVGFLLFLQSKN